MVDLAARHARVAEETERRVLEVLRSGHYVGGPPVEELEARVAGDLGRTHGVALASGTEALTVALMALDLGPGDEVIVPAVSFFATASAVALAGAVPVLVDVRPDRPLLDPAAVEEARSEHTRAVVPVHLFGDLARVDAPDLLVIDDAAQAAGGRPPRSLGVVTAVSFYPTKVLGGAGEGGLLATDDPELARRARLLRNHGQVEADLHERVGRHLGRNCRLDSLQAAVLLAALDDLPARVDRRRQLARRYDDALAGLALSRDEGSPVSAYCIRHPDRDGLARRLAERGIQTRAWYPRPLSAQPALQGLARILPTPQADRFCAEVLALPCHEGLSEAQVEHLLRALGELA